MNATLRLVIPDQKGIYRRIQVAVRKAGGHLLHSHLREKMPGLSEAEIEIACESESLVAGIVDSVAKVPGVTVLGDASAKGWRPSTP
jgi:hypothetical protein